MTGPVTCLHYPAGSASGSRVLLVMLPGAGMEAREFAAHGMVTAVQNRDRAVDVIAARPALDLYLAGDVAAALHDAVIAPARAQAGGRDWGTWTALWRRVLDLAPFSALHGAAP